MPFLTTPYPTTILPELKNCSTIQQIVIYKKRLLELLIFNQVISIPVPYSTNFIFKFQDKICLENILFVSKSLNNLLPSVSNTWFSFSSDQH